MSKTAIAAAMEKAGLPLARNRLRTLAHEALTKHHGNVDRAMHTFQAAVIADAEALRELLRPYLQQHFEHNFSRSGRSDVGSLSENAGRGNGGGQGIGARHTGIAAAEPSLAQRRAAASVAKVVAITVLDTFKVRDGRSIGDVRYGEIERIRSTSAREAAVLKQILDHVQAPPDTPIRDAVSAKELQRMIQKAAEVSDAV